MLLFSGVPESTHFKDFITVYIHSTALQCLKGNIQLQSVASYLSFHAHILNKILAELNMQPCQGDRNDLAATRERLEGRMVVSERPKAPLWGLGLDGTTWMESRVYDGTAGRAQISDQLDPELWMWYSEAFHW